MEAPGSRSRRRLGLVRRIQFGVRATIAQLPIKAKNSLANWSVRTVAMIGMSPDRSLNVLWTEELSKPPDQIVLHVPQARREDVSDLAVAPWAFLAKYQNAGASGLERVGHAREGLQEAATAARVTLTLENGAILIAPSP